MRLLALVVALLLSGCVTGTDPAPDAADAADAPPPEPVRVLERIDLTQGLPQTEWAMEVAPGFTDGRVVARLEGLADAPHYASIAYCYRFQGEQDDGSRYDTGSDTGCGTTGASYTSGSPRDLVRLDGDAFDSGWYRFTFGAKPSAAVLVVEMVAAYGHATGADQSAHA